MLMPRIQETTVYQFDELSDAAKIKAREWLRDDYPDGEWWDSTYEDARQCLALLGFTVKDIFFSGFWSQGDGACFTGSWAAADVKPVKALRQHAPKDVELRRLSVVLNVVKRRHRDAEARLQHTGRYSHERSVTIETFEAPTDEARETIEEAARDAMRWIYRQLEREYEWLTADAQVDGTIRANEYEFREDGRRAC